MTTLRRFGTFAGGIHLPDDKEATLDAPIVPAGRLARLRVPLAPAEAPPARPLVKAGQHVSQGQRLGQAEDDRQVDVFAPLGGRVGGLVEVMTPAWSAGWQACPAVELTDLDASPGIPAGGPSGLPQPAPYDWLAADDYSIRIRIREGGLMTHRSPVVPVGQWVNRARQRKADLLVANVLENVPFVTADHRLLAERGSEVVRGLAILARAIGCQQVVLAVDRRRTDDYPQAVGPARLYAIEPIALAHKYPTGADAMLIKTLTRREIPAGGDGLEVGVAVTDAATCWATYRWVACGLPPTVRVVTVSGPRVRSCGNYLVPFGAEAKEVLALAGAEQEQPRVHGPAMTGEQLVAGAVVSSQTNALLALAEPETGPPTPCIRCGWCSGHCPARLNVAALNDDFELARVGRARRRGALACIGCGICSYVCPARLPLAHRLMLLKQAIRRQQVPASA